MAHTQANRWLTIVCLLLVSSFVAAQQWHTTLEVLRPARYNIPQDIQHLLIVNYCGPQPEDFGHILLSGSTPVGKASTDVRQVPVRFLFSLTHGLEESGLFPSVSLLETTLNANGSFRNSATLKSLQVDSLCYEYQSDAALICNRFITYDTLGVFLAEDESYYAYLVAYEYYSFSLQVAGKSDATYYMGIDTLYWESNAYTLNDALAGLPDRQTALEDMAAYIGERFARCFYPNWETVDRYFYDCRDKDIKQGLEYLRYKQWDKAIAVWEQVCAAPKKSIYKAYAAANIAVVYEIKSDLGNALLWANKAVEAFSELHSAEALQQKVNMRYYIQQLEQRQKEEVLLGVL